MLALAAASDEQEIRWHAAQIFPRLKLSEAQRKTALDLLFVFLKENSRIVRPSPDRTRRFRQVGHGFLGFDPPHGGPTTLLFRPRVKGY